MTTDFAGGVRSRGIPLPSEGIPLTDGEVIHVDSGNSLASDGNPGTNPRHPMATLDAANGRCEANRGDIILLSPGHVEDLTAAVLLDLDIAGVSVIGMGNGPNRPRFDFNHADALISIGASGVRLENVVLRPSVTIVTAGIDIEAAVTDTLLKDVEIIPGEAGDGTDEFVDGILIKAGCTRTTIDGLNYAHHASAGAPQTAISLVGASDRVRIANFWIEGSGAGWVAGIQGITTLSTRLLIENGYITCDAEPGIELLTGTTGIISEVKIFSNLATIDAATVADGMAHFNVRYVEVGNEAGTLVKTESADD